MVERRQRAAIPEGGSYFTAPKTHQNFISSGSKLLDCALGGGWAEGRIANIVGDKSTGKTLLCIEVAANFARKSKKGNVYYREAESAFDKPYAEALGMPLDRVNFGDKPMDTVEELFDDLQSVLAKSKVPELYILDSLDALSDEAEMERDFGEDSYGGSKAKKMSELFRKIVRKVENAGMTWIVVSQVRDNIGVKYGPKTKRSGGRALDFYTSQVINLAQIEVLKRQVRNIEHPYGIKVRAKVTKNKVGLPLREAEFDLHFGYGVDDVSACLDWLKKTKYLADVDLTEAKIKDFKATIAGMSDEDYRQAVLKIHTAVENRWYEVEREFVPTRKKYL